MVRKLLIVIVIVIFSAGSVYAGLRDVGGKKGSRLADDVKHQGADPLTAVNPDAQNPHENAPGGVWVPPAEQTEGQNEPAEPVVDVNDPCYGKIKYFKKDNQESLDSVFLLKLTICMGKMLNGPASHINTGNVIISDLKEMIEGQEIYFIDFSTINEGFALDDTVLEIHSSVYPVLIKNLKLTDVSVAEGKAIVTKAEREIVFSGLNLKDYEIGVEVQSQVKIENSNIESVNGVAQIAIDIKQSIFPNVFTIIKNSTIKNCQAGVQLAGSGHEVVGNTIKNCGVGINVNNGQNIKLSNNTITNGVAAKGIVATDSSGLLLNSNEFDIYENIAEYLVEFNNTNVNTRVLDYRIDPIEPDPEHDCQADAKPANKEPCRVGKVFGPLQQGQYIQFYKLDQDLYKVNYNMDCISYGDANVWNDVLGFNNEDRTGIVFECSTINDELSSTKMYFTSVQQGVDGDGGSVDVETSSFAFFDHKDAGCVEKILTPTIELQGETIVIAPGATDETADEFIGDLGGGDDPSDFDNDGDDDLADNSDLGDQMAAGGITDAEAVTGQGAGNPGSGDGGFLFMPGSSGGAGSVASDPDRPCSLIISQNNSHNYLIFLLWLLPVIILRKIRFNK